MILLWMHFLWWFAPVHPYQSLGLDRKSDICYPLGECKCSYQINWACVHPDNPSEPISEMFSKSFDLLRQMFVPLENSLSLWNCSWFAGHIPYMRVINIWVWMRNSEQPSAVGILLQTYSMETSDDWISLSSVLLLTTLIRELAQTFLGFSGLSHHPQAVWRTIDQGPSYEYK